MSRPHPEVVGECDIGGGHRRLIAVGQPLAWNKGCRSDRSMSQDHKPLPDCLTSVARSEMHPEPPQHMFPAQVRITHE